MVLVLNNYTSVDIFYLEREKRDIAKGKMCKHQATDVLKIHSEKKKKYMAGGRKF